MSSSNRDITQLFGELTTAVEQLQAELESTRGPPRPPTPKQLARFSSEVTIPALILVLETNVRALRLVQRALRIAEGRDPETGPTRAHERATDIGRATLTRLDETLTDLGTALDDRPPEDDARELLDRIRDLESEIDAKLATQGDDTSERTDIDIDAELQSLKDDVEGDSSHEGDNDGS